MNKVYLSQLKKVAENILLAKSMIQGGIKKDLDKLFRQSHVLLLLFLFFETLFLYFSGHVVMIYLKIKTILLLKYFICHGVSVKV